jgi:hypothetical protein
MRLSRTVPGILTLLTCSAFASPIAAQDYSWPREIVVQQGRIVLYQPQPEKLTGNHLTARAAVSLLPSGQPDLVFGAVWLSGTIETDRDEDLVVIRNIHVTKVRWPNVTDEQAARFTQIVDADFPKDGLRMTLTRLTASLATAEREAESLEQLNNDPPKIVFTEQSAVLLLYDGEPQARPIENSSLERVVNTAFAVIREKDAETWYLGASKLWYSAPDPKGPWKAGAKPPAEIKKLAPPDTVPAPKTPPTLVVATEPTELVASDGKPNWQSVAGGKLLYVRNTETPWFRELESQAHFILLSGRWFRAASPEGPWSFVRPDSLPAAFAQIAPGSEVGGVRSFVAGTDEAEDALLDLQIPQTAAIKRSEAKLEVQWDGDPKFVEVPGTKVAYGENTGHQVLRIEGVYYAVDNGVWFTSKDAKGPWAVADSVPKEEIDKIPAESPVYNVQYVTVYESTPEVVYVGYTPGYMWAYPYYSVPVYGTGWYYPPYWGPVYYPRPVTYGFHVTYNPWTGWGMGMTVSNGFFAVGIHFGGYGGYYHGYHGGYYPPGGYRPPNNCFNCDINIGNNVGNRPSTRPTDGRGNNLYGGRGSQTTAGARPSQLPANSGNLTAKGPNNVYADRDGNVYRRDSNGGWQSRDAGGWSNSPSTSDRQRSSTGASPSTRPSPGGMERDYQARQRGATRSAPAPRAGGGGARRR